MFGQEKIQLDVAENVLYENRCRGRQRIDPDDILYVREYSLLDSCIVLVTKDKRRLRVGLYHPQYQEISAWIAENIAPGFEATVEHSRNVGTLTFRKMLLVAAAVGLIIFILMTIGKYS